VSWKYTGKRQKNHYNIDIDVRLLLLLAAKKAAVRSGIDAATDASQWSMDALFNILTGV